MSSKGTLVEAARMLSQKIEYPQSREAARKLLSRVGSSLRATPQARPMPAKPESSSARVASPRSATRSRRRRSCVTASPAAR